MSETVRKSLIGLGAVAVLGLGGAALAGAASNNSSAGNGANTAAPVANGYGYGAMPPGGPGGPGGLGGPGGPCGRHGGPGGPGGGPGPGEKPLTGATADKVKAAALKKVPGGTVIRVETDAQHGSPYEAHVRKSDGTEVEVLVNKDFEVTAVNEMRRP